MKGLNRKVMISFESFVLRLHNTQNMTIMIERVHHMHISMVKSAEKGGWDAL